MRTRTKKRTWERGCIYSEHYNKGGGHKALRNVAEVRIGGYRYRLRSTNYDRCCQYLDTINEVYRQFEKERKRRDRRKLADFTLIRLACMGILPMKKPGESDEPQPRPAPITAKEKENANS